jgi:uncharacterized protein (DUF885 family)
MKDEFRLLLSLAIVLVSPVCLSNVLAQENGKDEQARSVESAMLKETLTTITLEFLKAHPEAATSLAISREEAGGKYSDRLSDYSEAAEIRETAEMKTWLARLDKINANALADSDRVSLDVVRTALANGLGTAEFNWGTRGLRSTPYLVNQISGAYASIPDFLDSQHPLRSAEDAADYLKRLSAYAVVLDQESARITSDAERGVIPPDFAVDGAIKQLKKFAALKPAETVLVSSLARRLKETNSIEANAAPELVARAEKITSEEVLPAYGRQITALEAIRPKAPKEPGVWRLPGGEKYYAATLRIFTTSDLTPDQIHEMGLKLIEKFSAEADPLLKKLGYGKGSVGERLQALGKDERQIYPNTDDGRTKLLADLNKQTAAITAKMPLYFGVLAKANVQIKRVPDYIEAGAAGGYYMHAALDGSRPVLIT